MHSFDCLRVFFLNESSNTFDVSYAKTLKTILRGRKLPTGRILKKCFLLFLIKSSRIYNNSSGYSDFKPERLPVEVVGSRGGSLGDST